MALIRLTRGLEAIVDDEDFEWLSEFKWYAIKPGKCVYAVRDVKLDGVRHCIYLHRLVMGLHKGDKTIVDHINMNSLDNRKENLRLATSQQNAGNMRKWRGKYKYKGVRYCNKANRWLASIVVNRKQIHLGTWMTEEQAARAYNEAAIDYRGEFANLNCIIDTESVSNS